MAEKEVTVKVKVTDDTKDGLAGVGKSIQDTVDKAKHALEGLIAAFALEKVFEFFTSASEKAIEAEKTFQQVGVALRNIGINAQRVRPELEETFKSLSDETGIKIDSIAEAFARVTERTGSYSKALKLLPSVLDNMVARGNDAATAAKSVANASDGMIKALRENAGISGAAAAMNTGYVKTLNAIKNAWTEVQITLGDALLSGDQFNRSGDGLKKSLESVSTWIKDHKKEIADFRDGILAIASAFGWAAAKALGFLSTIKGMLKDRDATDDKFFKSIGWRKDDPVPMASPIVATPPDLSDPKGGRRAQFEIDEENKKAAEARAKEIAELTKIGDLHSLTTKQLTELFTTRDRLQHQADTANLTLSEQVTLLSQIKSLNEAIDKQGGSLQPTTTSTQSVKFEPTIAPASMAGIGSDGLTDQDRNNAKDSGERVTRVNKETEAYDNLTLALGSVSNAFADMFEAVGAGANVFQSIANAARHAIADIARQEGGLMFAKSAAELAEAIANPITAGPHLAAAAKFAGAGALFELVAGAAGGSGGGGGGGSGGGGGGISLAQYQQNQQDMQNGRGTATLVINGGLLDMTDPNQQQALAGAITTLTGMNILVLGGAH